MTLDADALGRVARFVALVEAARERQRRDVLDDVVEAAVGACLEALVAPASLLPAALRAAGHVDVASALVLPGGFGVHAVETGTRDVVGMALSGPRLIQGVVIDVDRGPEGAPDRPTGIRSAPVPPYPDGTPGDAGRVVADLVDDRVIGTEVDVSSSTWDHDRGTSTWEAGLRWLDGGWAELGAGLGEAVMAMGLATTWEAARAAMARRPHVAAGDATDLGVEVARAGDLALDAAMLATLSAMAAKAIEPAVAEALPALAALHTACLAHGLPDGPVDLSHPWANRDLGAMSLDEDGATLRIASRGTVLGLDIELDGAGAVRRLVVRSGTDPGPRHRVREPSTHPVAVSLPDPSGDAMMVLESLADLATSCAAHLAAMPRDVAPALCQGP